MQNQPEALSTLELMTAAAEKLSLSGLAVEDDDEVPTETHDENRKSSVRFSDDFSHPSKEEEEQVHELPKNDVPEPTESYVKYSSETLIPSTIKAAEEFDVSYDISSQDNKSSLVEEEAAHSSGVLATEINLCDAMKKASALEMDKQHVVEVDSIVSGMNSIELVTSVTTVPDESCQTVDMVNSTIIEFKKNNAKNIDCVSNLSPCDNVENSCSKFDTSSSSSGVCEKTSSCDATEYTSSSAHDCTTTDDASASGITGTTSMCINDSSSSGVTDASSTDVNNPTIATSSETLDSSVLPATSDTQDLKSTTSDSFHLSYHSNSSDTPCVADEHRPTAAEGGTNDPIIAGSEVTQVTSAHH